jgi:hypothetical protein
MPVVVHKGAIDVQGDQHLVAGSVPGVSHPGRAGRGRRVLVCRVLVCGAPVIVAGD